LGRMLEPNQDIASLLADGLQSWQQRKANIPLIHIPVNEETIARSRSIIIPVDVPSVMVVHTADLKLLDVSSIHAEVMAALNQPISASLVIKWTRTWDTEYRSETVSTEGTDFLEFFYEVSGASDTWLIGGRRKGHFRIPIKQQTLYSREALVFPVILIPLREGFVPFPNVDIKPSTVIKIPQPGASDTENDSSRVKQPVVTCETDYKNLGETIRVISDARKTTVSLDASGPQGGAWLLESERRGLGNGVLLG